MNQIIDLRKELRAHKFELGLLQKIPCTREENRKYLKLRVDGGALPKGVYEYADDFDEKSSNQFYTIHESDLTDDEIRELLMYRQLSMTKTIKNCVLFFTVLTIIGMVLGFIFAVSVH